MLNVPERIAQVAEHFARHDAHGYSQANRGTGNTETFVLSDGSPATISARDVDCSEMARQCVNVALSGSYQTPIPYMWTGNMPEVMASAGFKQMPFSPGSAERGTIVLRNGHTAVSLGGGLVAEAATDETGGITGPQQGDQTGREVRVAALGMNWRYVYRYGTISKEETSKEEKRADKATAQKGDEMICIIQPNGAGYLEYFDGSKVHPLAHPDEVTALNMVYQRTHDGKSIPCFALGTKSAPWATRLHNALR